MCNKYKIQRYSRSAFISYLAEQNCWDEKWAREVLDQVLNGIGNFLLEKCGTDGCSLTIPHFGMFIVKPTPPRKGVNLRTGQVMEIGKRNRISFKPSTDFKKAIKGDYHVSYET